MTAHKSGMYRQNWGGSLSHALPIAKLVVVHSVWQSSTVLIRKALRCTGVFPTASLRTCPRTPEHTVPLGQTKQNETDNRGVVGIKTNIFLVQKGKF